MGDGSHLLVCKQVNAGQIAAHDDAVRRIGAELDSYGVVVRYEQRALAFLASWRPSCMATLIGFLGLLAAFLAAYVAAAPLIVTLKQQKKMKVNNTHTHA